MRTENTSVNSSNFGGSSKSTASPANIENICEYDAHHKYRLQAEAFTPTHALSSNHRMEELCERYRAIYDMTRLPEEHPFFLPHEIAQHARDCLAVLVNNSNVEAPRLLNRGGEALSFTWRTSDGKVYLTVDETDIDVLELTPNGDTSTSLTSGGDFEWATVLNLLGGNYSSDVSK